ncbi:uncharacterized protein [Danio rerio]|uniref:Uncharacterized protein n=1 Tax=Danio rerio TaxID=7955 RepID=A0AC58J2N4_DANRE
MEINNNNVNSPSNSTINPVNPVPLTFTEEPAAPELSTVPQTEPQNATRSRRSTRSSTRLRTSSTPPSTSRQQATSPASSYATVSSFRQPTRITISELRKHLADLGIHAPRTLNKPELLKLYSNATSDSHPLLSTSKRPITREPSARHTPYPQPTRTQPGKRKSKTKHVSSSAPTGPHPQESQSPPATSHRQDLNQGLPVSQLLPPSFSWPPAPPSSSPATPPIPPISSNPFQPNVSAPPAFQINQPFSLPPQPSTSYSIPHNQPASSLPTYPIPPSFSLPLAHTSTDPTQTLPAPVSSARPSYTLFTATPLPMPPNALALDPTPISTATRNQILSEISAVSTRSGPSSNTCSSLFRDDIAINHPLHHLRESAISLILQGVAPRTLQSYLTAWSSFKNFHCLYKTHFPDFSLLSITSFIAHLHLTKNLQASSIRSYLSGIQFFHKLIHGSPSEAISNFQTSLLIKGIQKSHPSSPDTRQPITLNILSKCIHTLRKGYISIHTARTLDAMFTLAFFGFLRCSELTITSNFNPTIHPTLSDLTLLDEETLSFFIKQSKTDQLRRGHPIYIFDIPSPTQPFQTLKAYMHYRRAQEPNRSAPLFTDDANRPVTRFWFQFHLKEILRISGFPPEPFSSHSFRIGAATTAAHNGLSQQQIQTLGRWSSNAYKSYIRLSQYHLREAQQILGSRHQHL